MNHPKVIIGLLLLAMLLSGCGGASLHEAHEGQLLDDKVLQQRVEAALKRGGKDFEHVQVSVADGTVTLAGAVNSAEARERAAIISHGVYGVGAVDDDIDITPATQPSGQ